MPTERISLAIETSSAIDSIALGRGDEWLETVVLPKRAPGRSSPLMPAIAELFERLNLDRQSLDEIYVSVGPGSFTGLRVGITVAQMLATVLDAKTVAVPTIDVVARVAPASDGTLLVCLNQKRDTIYGTTFKHDGVGWSSVQPAAVMTIADALARAPRPLHLLSQTQLKLNEADLDGVSVLPVEFATPSAKTVWQLGRDAAAEHAYTAAPRLLPIYARVPEAVELWDQRHGPSQQKTS